MSKISIVIPIYNTQEYLRECLDSVVNQTLKDIEIILVDDGSTDGSIDICKKYASLDSRIRLIVQENVGAAAARKTGANAATSTYIGFVDSDDTIEPDMYETLLSLMDDCDLVTSAARREDGGIWQDHLSPKVYRTSKEMEYVIDNMLMIESRYIRGISGAIHCKLFRTILVKKVFDSVDLRIYCNEDVEFICRYLLECDSVRVTDICKYHYRLRNDSIVHSPHNDFMINLNLLYLNLCQAFKGHPSEMRLLEQLQMYIAWYCPSLPTRMGFLPNIRLLRYVNPIANDIIGKRIVLYGAGDVGKDYYLYMMRLGKPPVLWVDNQYEKYRNQYPVHSIKEIFSYEYDLLVIAVMSPDIAKTIKSELMRLGVVEEKIFWKEPIKVL